MLHYILLGLLAAFVVIVKNRSKNAPAYNEVQSEDGICFILDESTIQSKVTAEYNSQKVAA